MRKKKKRFLEHSAWRLDFVPKTNKMPPPPPPPQAKQQQQQQRQQQEQPVEEEQQPQDPSALKIVVANVDVGQAEGNDRRTKNGKFTLAQLRATDGICPLQNGTNQFDSQKLMTNFGTPRDVKGKHLKRIWELEFPEEAADYQQQMPPVNAAPQQQQPQAQPTAR
uniref:Uncharacterized protein n=1 Tax=Globodera rostochiensis TaxID=31243 RepID=A0A914HEI0_GLORO